MAELYRISRSVLMDPSCVGPDLKAKLLTKAKQSYVGKCSISQGIILDVVNIYEILDNHISRSSNGIMFNVVLDVKMIMPREGNVYEGKVYMILPDKGIFVMVEEVMNIVLPFHALQDQGFVPGEGHFYVNHATGKKITMHEQILVKLGKFLINDNRCRGVGSLKV